MRKLLFTLLLIASTSIVFAQKHKGPINWLTLEQADSLYKIKPKPMFIDVYTDWCGWCKRMDATTFQDKGIANYLNSNYYPVKLDAETKDSIMFLGHQYTNSQSIKVKHLLDSLKNELLSLEDSIKKTDSNITKQISSLEPNLNFFRLVKVQTDSLLQDTANKSNLVSLNKSNFKVFKSDLKTKYKNQNFSKVEYTKLIKGLKALKKAKTSELIEKELGLFKTSLTTLNDSVTTLQKQILSNPLKPEFLQKKNKFLGFQRRARKTTHDVAIELCNGQMSYPTFVILFDDSLRQNFQLKGYQKVPDLFGKLGFFAEGIFRTSRDLQGFVNEFQKVYAPGYKEPKDLIKWKSFDKAIKAAKRDKKKILDHIMHPQSLASNLMDKESFREPSTAKKINKNFHAVKFFINEQGTITHNGQEFKFENGVHQFAFYLSRNKLSFPNIAFLDEKGNLVMNVPQYFKRTQMNPVLDYFIEEGYLKGTYGDWLKTKKK